jgi:hypothetical protein
MSKRNLKRLVASLWAVNLVLALFLTPAWLVKIRPSIKFLNMDPTTTASLTSTHTLTLTPSDTYTFTHSRTVAPTKTPRPTRTQTNTPTPIPFSEGPIVIGYSVEKRPIEVLRFGTGPSGRLIVAGMHGGSEYNTIQLADQLIAHIVENPSVVPENITLYILRNLNPDGEASGHTPQGRANANGVDLNRNWDANWQADWPRDTCWNITNVTSGKGPGSEPETQALMSFIQDHPITAIINYHSAALGIFAGGLPADPGTLRLAEAVASVTTYPYPPIDIGCEYTGGFTDWADEMGIAALDVELSNKTNTDLDMNLLVLQVLLEWEPSQ